MSFVIRGLSPEPFRPLFALDDAALWTGQPFVDIRLP